MSTDQNEIHREFRATLRRFATDKVAPYAAMVDRERRPPIEMFAAAAEVGLQGLPYPERLGGQDGDMYTQCIVLEEIAGVCASSALTISSSWILMAVVDYGSDAQQQEILPEIISGKARCAWGLTEPQGGSDLMASTTTATKTADGWILQGTKRFITNGGWAEWYMIFARTNAKRFGLFLVNKNDPGVSFGAQERKMGMRGSPTSDVILDNVHLSHSRVLGDPERGGEYINAALLRSRLQIAAHALGIAGGALKESVAYTTDREQFGQPIAAFQMLRGMIADMAIRVEAGRSTLYRAIDFYMAKDPAARLHASVAKVLCSDAAMSVTTDAVQLHGGYGYLEDYPVERMMRDAKVTQIWEGTNQIQRLMIAKDVYEQIREK